MCIPKLTIVKCSLIALGTFNFISCKAKEETNITLMATNFSNLECRAFAMRKLRYNLADKIRFAEDSVANLPPGCIQYKNLQLQLQKYQVDKENSLVQSLQLADTIKLQLDSILKIRLQSSDKIKLFDKALLIEMEKKNCK